MERVKENALLFCKVSNVPINLLKFVRILTNSFQWTWNISERLAFTEVLTMNYQLDISVNEAYDLLNINNNTVTKLEEYLQEYFTKVMKKLKELNYKIQEKTDDTLF